MTRFYVPQKFHTCFYGQLIDFLSKSVWNRKLFQKLVEVKSLRFIVRAFVKAVMTTHFS